MIGRTYEYQLIKEKISSQKAELGIVYGRRRVGKSTLLQALTRESRSLYFEGIKGLSSIEQIKHFCRQLAAQTKTLPILANSWHDAFNALTAYVKNRKIYIVFDEFPWMANERQELVGILKFYWDNNWKKNPKITLVLCGSVAQFMVKHLIHSEALHNRKTFEMKIFPLPCNEAALFLKNKRSLFEAAQFLMAFGGIPKYLEQLEPKESLDRNMDRLCFKKNSFFVNEFETLFKEQFKVIKTYEKIVKALSSSKLTKEELAKKIKTTSGGGLTTYLSNLEQAEFIRKEVSIDIYGKGEKTKTVKYVLSDEWLRFYFTYMASRLKTIEINTQNGLFEKVTSSSLANYWGISFENFCIKNIEVIFKALDIKSSEVLSWGPYFKQGSRKHHAEGVQIDIVILKKSNVVVVVECKFTEGPVGISIVKEVQSKIKKIKIPTKATIEKVLISANGVLPSVEKEDYFNQILTLRDLFVI